jgi:hypothetical protein
MQRGKGKEHHAAVRALAFKWIRIIWKCWQARTPYNEVLYPENLRKKGSRCSSSPPSIRLEVGLEPAYSCENPGHPDHVFLNLSPSVELFGAYFVGVIPWSR